MSSRTVTVRMPGSLGNFGPGFDAFSLAVAEIGDEITVEPAGRDSIELAGPGAEVIPTDWRKNTAGLALDALREAADVEDRVRVQIRKGMPPGSGLGSSASSAAGTVVAFHHLHPELELAAEDLVLAAGEAEAHSSGRHYDDVAACVLGGLAIVGPTDGTLRLARIQPPENLHLALAIPDLALSTKTMRELLPTKVALADAVANLSNASHLVAAFHTGDIPTIGRSLTDRLATPARAVKMPYLADATQAAVAAGAYGAAVSGSGPSLVAVCGSQERARQAAAAMQEAVQSHDIACRTRAARPETREVWRGV